ncbi:MAG: hypothetical protein ACR2P3_02510 [Geminicoccaceae bacterium]
MSKRSIALKTPTSRRLESMMSIRFLLIAALLIWPGFTLSADDHPSIDSFVGDWKGADVVSKVGRLAPDALTLRIQTVSGGFRTSWRDLGKSGRSEIGSDTTDAQFVLTDRPGVYEYAQKPGSLLTRMFASPATGNPLKGETLLWARIDGPLLAVYSMKVDPEGGFDLDHYS